MLANASALARQGTDCSPVSSWTTGTARSGKSRSLNQDLRASVTPDGRRSARSLPRARALSDERDTVDLVQSTLTGFDDVERGLTQKAGAKLARRFFDATNRLAADDQLSDLVVQHENLGNGLAATEACAATMPAAAAGPKVPAL